MNLQRREIAMSQFRSPVATAWGMAQSATEFGPGVVRYTTAGHGGFELSALALSQMPPMLRSIPTYAGSGWYEEDCDWCIVALAFPNRFSDVEIFHALRTFKAWHSAHSGWLSTPEASVVTRRVESFAAEHGGHFVVASMSTAGGGWTLNLRSVDGTKHAVVKEVRHDELHDQQPFDIARFGDRAQVFDEGLRGGRNAA